MAKNDKKDQEIIAYLENAVLQLQVQRDNRLLENAEKGNLEKVKQPMLKIMRSKLPFMLR